MGSEWQVEKLADCMDAIIDYRGKTPKKTDSGIPLITAKIIKNGRILPTTEYISVDDYDDWMRRGLPEAGDVVLTTEAPLGEVAQLDSRKVALAQRVITLRGKKGHLHNTYLKYLLQSNYVQHQLSGRSTGTTVTGIKQSELREIELRFPTFTEQKAIGFVLGILDDKIELNCQINQILESMAQALFKSWFVDFDPVIDNALAACNEIPEPFAQRAAARQALKEKANAGDSSHPTLPEDIRQLFPSAFQFTEELGWIPEGWKVDCYSTIAELNPESWSNMNRPAAVNYIDLANTKNGVVNEITTYSFDDAPSRARRILRPNDTIIGTVRPGNRSYAYVFSEGLTGSTGFAVMRPKEENCRAFLYFSLTQDRVIENFAHLADGAAYPAIRPDVIANTLSVIPSSGVLKAFQLFATPILSRIGHSQIESNTLTETRDILLPKLLSGELRFPAAEKLAAEAET